MAAKVKIYADRMSQPSRAIIIFCKVNQIDFEEVTVSLIKSQHRSPDFMKINPMGKVPAIVDGRFKLFESHAILRYLASVFPGIPDHWYPSDLFARAKIESILDWHHSNLRSGSAQLVLNLALAPFFGIRPNPDATRKAEKLLTRSLATIESVWLGGRGKFLLGNPKPSIADLSLVCEIMQLELLDDVDRDRLLAPHQKVRAWIDNVRRATSPHFEQVHETIHQMKASRRTSDGVLTNTAPGVTVDQKSLSKL